MYRDQVIKPKQKERFTQVNGWTKESQSGFYATAAWIKVRDRRRAENPICQECEKKGMIRPMYIIDHPIPIDERPDLALDYDNTQSLCKLCHIRKTNADKKRKNQQRKLEQGRQLMKQLETGGG
jgi:5-methylcytosine-specific restriction protein A